jgi:hypothetical protein
VQALDQVITARDLAQLELHCELTGRRAGREQCTWMHAQAQEAQEAQRHAKRE